METTNEISRNLRFVFREEFMGQEMIIGEKFPRFGEIFTPDLSYTRAKHGRRQFIVYPHEVWTRSIYREPRGEYFPKSWKLFPDDHFLTHKLFPENDV